MPEKVGNIEFFVGPHTLGPIDNLESTIIDFIKGAKKRLEIAIQELDSWNIANAIVKMKQGKVSITIVLEGDYLKSYPGLKNPYSESGKLSHNREIMAVLLRAGVNLKIDFNSKIFHQKFIVRDRESLLTGSTNFTDTGTHNNLNHLIIIHDKQIAMHYYREFKEIISGQFGKRNEGHDPAPETINVSGVPIKVLFAPDHNPEMEIMKQMSKAKSRIDFAIFTFSQSSGIDDTMMLLDKAGVKVRGIFDAQAGNQKWAAAKLMDKAGIDAFLASNYYAPELDEKLGKVHHKLMVIDEQVIIGGSFNYTQPANLLNDENIFIIGEISPDISIEQEKSQRKLGKYVLDEIGRMIKVFGKEVVSE